MRHKAGTLTAVALILLAIIGFVYNTQQSSVMARVEETLTAKLSNALDAKVSIGRFEIISYKKAAIYDAALYDKHDNLLAASNKVTVTFHPLSVLLGQATMDAISRIEVEQPEVYLTEHDNGTWNIEEIFTSGEQKDKLFHGEVVIHGGTAHIAGSKGQWLLEGVEGSLNFARPSAAAELSAIYQGTKLTLEGVVGGKDSYMLRVKADKIEISMLSALLAADSKLHIDAGTAQEISLAVQRQQGQLVYAGEAKVVDAALGLSGLPVSGLNGLVAFTQENLYLYHTTAKVYDQPVTVSGRIALNTSEPIVELTASSTGLDPDQVGLNLPVHGSVAFTATIAGAVSNPIVSGDFTLPQGQIDAYPAANVRAKLAVADKVLTIKTLTGRMLGGVIAASGTVKLDGSAYRLQLKGTGLDSSELAGAASGLTGAADVALAVTGAGPLTAATIEGTIAMDSGRAAGIAFHNLNSGFFYSGGKVTLDYLTLGVDKGVVTAAGTIENGNLALMVRGQQLPLAMLASAAGMDMDGSVNVEGTLTGTQSAPIFTAAFTAADGHVLKQPFQSAGGTISVDKTAVALRDVVINGGTAQHTLAGSVGLASERPLNMTITTHQARAENLAKLFGLTEKITGNVDNQIIIRGTAANPLAEGKVVLTDGSFAGQLVARAEGSYSHHDGITEIRDFTIHSLNTKAQLAGTIADDGSLALDFTARDIDLAKLHLNFPYPINGHANFTGKLSGTAANPAFAGQLTADSMEANGQVLQAVTATLYAADHRLYVPYFGFGQGEGKFNFKGGADFAAGTVYGDFTVEQGQIGTLLSILNVPAQGITGRLNGTIAVGGTLARPDIRLTGTLTDGSIKNYPLNSIDMDVALANNVLTFYNFNAKQGTGVLAIRGTADLNGPLNLEVGGRDIDAGLLTAWFDTAIDTRGKLGFAAQISGTADKPHAAVSLEIAGGGVANATFDNLYGLFILDKGSIHVNQLMVAKGPYRASAYGVIPFAALSEQGRANATEADQMNLKVHLDEADLSILPMLTKEVAWAKGQTKGELTIGGTLAHPTLNGEIVIPDGTIKLASLADPIQKVDVDIQFTGDKIDVKTFAGRMGAGDYSLTGSAAIKGWALADYHMALTLNKLGVNHKYFKGPLSGMLTLTDTGKRPLLAGTINLENDTVDIPYVPELTASRLNLGLNVEVTVGKRVRLYNAYMYDIWAEGRIKFGGTMIHPDVNGHISATRGTVNYLRTDFKIKDASADFIQRGSFIPNIKLNAETRLERTTISLALNGPVTAMDMQLTAQPAMSQQEILSLLTLRSRYYDKQKEGGGRDSGLGREELVSLLDAGLQMRFVSEMEAMFRNAFGLDEFRFVRGTLSSDSDDKRGAETVVDREVYNIEIGKYVTDRLMLSYTMGLDHREYNAGFRYDLTPAISFTGSIDEQSRRRIGVETRFNF